MAKQLNVNLQMTADTSQAKAQLKELQQTLTSLTSQGAIGNGFSGTTSEINKAISLANDLKFKLQDATNVNTGKLDLTKFNASLKQSGLELKDYANALNSLGPQGRQSFTQLADSIKTSSTQFDIMNTKLGEFATVMKNTVRWQISSSMIHGFIGSVQSAYSYAQKLNSSLNSIQIVTGQTAEQMSEFADKANRAAQALSTTTTAYTDAALIFYQQGLNDEEVAERTETTIKLANVTGESASDISSYMTSIWNNFDDGSESLEHYADVITALGATTASSSSEIAEGLEKFAAVADTVGLSYDYASSAIATVVADTRQSADTVGTAFKTIFARIDDLKLGNSVDDGTTLDTYSQALKTIGVNIKNSNGELKDMDSILSEMGSKWQTLSKDTQTAVAQTVAGTRQYSQLIALMDNWDDFKENLTTAQDSEDSLNEQAEIYAQSWEGAQKRVKAAAQAIYSDLLDDQFFIKITNSLATVLQGIHAITESLGGTKGILLLISTLATSVFKEQIASGIDSSLMTLKSFTKTGKQELENLKLEAEKLQMSLILNNYDFGAAGDIRKIYEQVNEVQKEFEEKSKSISSQERTRLEIAKQNYNILTETVAKEAERYSQIVEENQNTEAQMKSRITAQAKTKKGNPISEKRIYNKLFADTKNGDEQSGAITNLRKANSHYYGTQAAIKEMDSSISKTDKEFEGMQNKEEQTKLLKEMGNAYEEAIKHIKNYKEADKGKVEEIKEDIEALNKKIQATKDDTTANVENYKELKKLKNDLSSLTGTYSEVADAEEAVKKALTGLGIKGKEQEKIVQQLVAMYKEQGQQLIVNKIGMKNSKNASEEMKKTIATTGDAFSTFGDKATSALNCVSSLSMGLNSLSAGLETLSNPDISGWEKFTSVTMSFSMGLGMLLSGLRAINLEEIKNTAQIVANNAVRLIQNGLIANYNAMTGTKITRDELEILLNNKKATGLAGLLTLEQAMTYAEGEEVIVAQALTEEGTAQVAAKTLLAVANALGVKNAEALTLAELKETIATKLHTSAVWADIAAQLVANPLFWVAAAALTALAIAYGVAAAAAYKNAQALKSAKEAASNAKDGYDQATEALTNLTDAWDELTNSKNTLDGLTKGTTEWYEALAKANQQITELLETYPELADAVSIDANGQMTLDEEKYQEVLKERIKIQQIAQANYDVLNTKAKNLEKTQKIDSKENALTKNETVLGSDTDYNEGAKQTVAQKANANTTKKIAEKLDISDITALKAGKENENYESAKAKLDNATKYTDISSSEILNNEKNLDLLKSIKEEQNEIAKNNNLLGTQLSTIAQTVLENTDEEFANLNDHTKQTIANVAGQLAADEDVQEQAQDEVEEKYKTDDEMIEEYASIMKIDEDSDEYEDITAETAKNYLVQEQALKDIDSDLEKIKREAKAIQDVSGDIAKGEGQISGAAQNNMLEYKQDWTKAKFDASTIDDATADILDKAIDQKSGEYKKLQQVMGEEGAKAYVEAYTKAKEEGLITEATKSAAFAEEIESAAGEKAASSGLDSERISNLATEYAKLAQSQNEANDAAADSAKLAADLATQDLKLNDAVDELYTNLDDYKEVLSSLKKNGVADILTNEELSETYTKLKKNVANLIDVEEDFIDNDFLVDNMKDIQKAANGDEDAIKRLQKAAQKEVVLAFDDSGLLEAVGKDKETMQDWLNNLPDGELNLEDTNFVNTLVLAMQKAGMAQTDIEAKLGDLGIYAELGEYGKTLDEAVNAAGIAGDKIVDSLSFDSSMKTTTASTTNESTASGWTATVEQEPYSAEVPWRSDDGNYSMKTITGKFPNISITPEDAESETTTESTAMALEVKNATKKSGGNISYKNSSAGRRARRRSSSRSSRRTNTQASKSGSDEKERYHVVKNQYEDLEKQYTKISTAKDRAFGKSKLKLMDQEIAKTKQLIDKQKEYVEAIKAQLAVDKQNLNNSKKTYVDTTTGKTKTVNVGAENYLGISVEYDENGTITNYDALMDAALAKYNKAVAVYDTKKTDDEKAKQKFEAAEQQYEAFKELLSQYEETQDLYWEETQTLLDKQNEYYDELLEKTEYEVEIKIDVDDDKLSLLEFLLDNIHDNAIDAADAITDLGKIIDTTFDEIDTTSATGLAGILNNHGYDGNQIISDLKNGNTSTDQIQTLMNDESFTSDEVDQMRTYLSNLISYDEKLLDSLENVFSKIGDVFDYNNEKIENTISKMETLNETASTYKDILSLLGKKTTGASASLLAGLNAANVGMKQDQLQATVAQRDLVQAEYDKAHEAYLKAETEEDKKYWEEQLDTMDTKLKELNNELASSLEEALQASVDAFNDNIQNAVDEASEKLGGLVGSVEALQKEIEQTQTTHSVYVDEYERVYQLSKLTRDINKSIDETSNIKAKQELAKLQEEIYEKQKSGAEMSEYELENLRREYELKQAQIALEEAQNAKSSVSMVRDNEGNFSYMYTANDEDVEEAEQNYSDKLYAMQQANAEYINTLQNNLLSIQQDYLNAFNELAETYEIGSDEYNVALEKLQEEYTYYFNATCDQLQIVLGENEELYTEHAITYGILTGDMTVANEQYVSNFGQTELAIQGGWSNMEQYQQNFNETSQSLLTAASGYVAQYQGEVDNSLKLAGTSLKELADDTKEKTKDISDDSKDLANDVDDDTKDMENSWNSLMDTVEEFEKNYSQKINDIIDTNDKLIESYNAVLEAWTKMNSATSSGNSNSGSSSNSRSNSRTSSTSSRSTSTGTGSSSTTRSTSRTTAAKLSLSPTALSIKVGESGKITATVSGGSGDISWSSSKTSVATCSGSGKTVTIKAVSNGQTTITAKYSGKTATATISVYGGYSSTSATTTTTTSSNRAPSGATIIANAGATTGIYNGRSYSLTGYRTKTYIGTAGGVDRYKYTFKSGGYTGEWTGGSEEKNGRLALLHQKELVLNEDDTKNMLATVAAVRQITNAIDVNTQSFVNGLTNATAASVGSSSQDFQQTVTITAEFPNATSKTEIEEAFTNLINKASQYANRNNNK